MSTLRESLRNLSGVDEADRETFAAAFVDGVADGAGVKDDPAKLIRFSANVSAVLAAEIDDAESDDDVRKIAALYAALMAALGRKVGEAAKGMQPKGRVQ